MSITTLFDNALADARQREAAAAAKAEAAAKAKAEAEAARKVANAEHARRQEVIRQVRFVEEWVERFITSVIRTYETLPENKKWSASQLADVQRYSMALVACNGTLPPIDARLATIVQARFAFGFVLMHQHPDKFQIKDGFMVGQREPWFEEAYTKATEIHERNQARKSTKTATSQEPVTEESGDKPDTTTDYLTLAPLTVSLGDANPALAALAKGPATMPRLRKDGRPGHGAGRKTKSKATAVA